MYARVGTLEVSVGLGGEHQRVLADAPGCVLLVGKGVSAPAVAVYSGAGRFSGGAVLRGDFLRDVCCSFHAFECFRFFCLVCLFGARDGRHPSKVLKFVVFRQAYYIYARVDFCACIGLLWV